MHVLAMPLQRLRQEPDLYAIRLGVALHAHDHTHVASLAQAELVLHEMVRVVEPGARRVGPARGECGGRHHHRRVEQCLVEHRVLRVGQRDDHDARGQQVAPHVEVERRHFDRAGVEDHRVVERSGPEAACLASLGDVVDAAPVPERLQVARVEHWRGQHATRAVLLIVRRARDGVRGGHEPRKRGTGHERAVVEPVRDVHQRQLLRHEQVGTLDAPQCRDRIHREPAQYGIRRDAHRWDAHAGCRLRIAARRAPHRHPFHDGGNNTHHAVDAGRARAPPLGHLECHDGRLRAHGARGIGPRLAVERPSEIGRAERFLQERVEHRRRRRGGLAYRAPRLVDHLVEEIAAHERLRCRIGHPAQEADLRRRCRFAGLLRPPHRRRGAVEQFADEFHTLERILEHVVAALHPAVGRRTRRTWRLRHRCAAEAILGTRDDGWHGKHRQRDRVDGHAPLCHRDLGRRLTDWRRWRRRWRCRRLRLGAYAFRDAAVDGLVDAGTHRERGRAAHEPQRLEQLRRWRHGCRRRAEREIDAPLDVEEEEADLAADFAGDARDLRLVRHLADDHRKVRPRTDVDDEQVQRAADVQLTGEDERVEAQHGVEAAGHLRVEADALAAPHDADVQPRRDCETRDRHRQVGRDHARREALAGEHEVARPLEHLEDLRVDLVDVAPKVQVPVLRVVEVEERLDGNADLEQRRDGELHRDADGERAAPHVEIDDGEERPLRIALELRHHREEVRLHHEQQPRPRQLQQDDAPEVEDDARAHGADDRADTERPRVDLGLPRRNVHGVATRDVLQPRERRRHRRRRRLLPPVVHREQAEEPVDAQAGVGERDGDGKLDFQRDDHAGGLAPALVDVGDAHARRDAHLHGNDGEIDLSLDLVLVHLHVAAALQRAGNVDACRKRGQLRRSQWIEFEPHPCALDRHHAEIHRKPEIDFEDQRVVARNARAEDGEDLVER